MKLYCNNPWNRIMFWIDLEDFRPTHFKTSRNFKDLPNAFRVLQMMYVKSSIKVSKGFSWEILVQMMWEPLQRFPKDFHVGNWCKWCIWDLLQRFPKDSHGKCLFLNGSLLLKCCTNDAYKALGKDYLFDLVPMKNMEAMGIFLIRNNKLALTQSIHIRKKNMLACTWISTCIYYTKSWLLLKNPLVTNFVILGFYMQSIIKFPIND